MGIRSVQQSDANAVYTLLCELENKPLPKNSFLKGFARQFMDDTITAWVFLDQGCMIGYVSLRILYHLHHCAYVAMIEELVVQKEYQNKGYGSKLFQQACNYAKQHDCIQLELSSKQTRKQAHQFYQQQGMHCEHYKFTMALI